MSAENENFESQEGQLSNISTEDIYTLDEVISDSDPYEYFGKVAITSGMKNLFHNAFVRLSGNSSDSILHLSKTTGGSNNYIMAGLGMLAKNQLARQGLYKNISDTEKFEVAKVAAFDGRDNPETYFWGEIAKQLEKEDLFKEYWENGVKAPDESNWLELFEGDVPVLIMFDELSDYFDYYAAQADDNKLNAIKLAFSNMLTASQKKKAVCIVIAD